MNSLVSVEVYLEDGCVAADLEEAAILQPRLQEGDERAALEHGEVRDGVDWRGGPGVGRVLAVPLAALLEPACSYRRSNSGSSLSSSSGLGTSATLFTGLSLVGVETGIALDNH